MRRYFLIFSSFFKNGLMAELEYRFEILSWALVTLAWMGLAIFSVELIFGAVGTVAGWDKEGALLIVYTHSLVAGLIWSLITPSAVHFSELVGDGGLDFYLAKPINTRFLVSVSKFEFDPIIRMAFSIFLLTLYFLHLGSSLANIGLFIIFIILGTLIIYNIFFIVTTSAIWFVNLERLEDLLDNFTMIARYPTDIFSGLLKFVLTFILPIAFIATFPAKAVLGKVSVADIFIAFSLLAVTFLISQWFWNFALKRYSSASS